MPGACSRIVLFDWFTWRLGASSAPWGGSVKQSPSTGCTPPALRRAAFHPWLHCGAPLGLTPLRLLFRGLRPVVRTGTAQRRHTQAKHSEAWGCWALPGL